MFCNSSQEWIFILIAFAAEVLKFDQAKTYPIAACSFKIQLNDNVKIYAGN
jgi:hypothetical protein